MSYSSERIAKMRSHFESQGMDAFYIRDLSNIKWLTAFDAVFDDEPAHALLIMPHKAVFHTDSRYAEAAKAAAQYRDIVVDVKPASHVAWVASILENEDKNGDKITKIGIESSLSLAEFRQLEKTLLSKKEGLSLVETHECIQSLRSVKDAEEIRRMKHAQSITDAAFAFIVDYIAPGMTEREAQIALEDYMIRHGAAGLAFSSIVATGANGANPHAIPGDTPFEAGQSVVIDFGARAQGYCSDMTRTVFIGTPDARLVRAYEVMREANETVTRMLEPGITGAQAQEVAENILAAGGFAGAMGHSLGHGVGVEVHEQPILAARNTVPLVVGNVVTVEPGIYRVGEFGMRLEDFGVIVENGFDVFTQSSHDMVII